MDSDENNAPVVGQKKMKPIDNGEDKDDQLMDVLLAAQKRERNLKLKCDEMIRNKRENAEKFWEFCYTNNLEPPIMSWDSFLPVLPPSRLPIVRSGHGWELTETISLQNGKQLSGVIKESDFLKCPSIQPCMCTTCTNYR